MLSTNLYCANHTLLILLCQRRLTSFQLIFFRARHMYHQPFFNPFLSFSSVCIVQIISPRGGTLVLFDSVSLPHEVMTTLEGERLALAGWLHEKNQVFPSWFVG